MTVDAMRLPATPSRAPDIEDDFSGPELRGDLWLGHYLPHWTTPDRSQARYGFDAAGLRLRIDHDQPDWREEDAPLRVSNLQTGSFSGGWGSPRGTHRHRPEGLLVRTVTPMHLLWAPSAGRVDVTVSASVGEACMLAGWLVGTEHLAAEHAGEVCIFEIDAAGIASTQSVARCGVKAHHDPALTTDIADVVVPLDASRPHTWTAIWGAGETLIGCEGRIVRRLAQAPQYPLFLMLDLFELGARGDHADYPKTAHLQRVRGWTGTARSSIGQ